MEEKYTIYRLDIIDDGIVLNEIDEFDSFEEAKIDIKLNQDLRFKYTILPTFTQNFGLGALILSINFIYSLY